LGGLSANVDGCAFVLAVVSSGDHVSLLPLGGIREEWMTLSLSLHSLLLCVYIVNTRPRNSYLNCGRRSSEAAKYGGGMEFLEARSS
jgi:hypothetical protein